MALVLAMPPVHHERMDQELSTEARAVAAAMAAILDLRCKLTAAQEALREAQVVRRAAIIADVEASGVSAERIARRHGVTASWVKTLRSERAQQHFDANPELGARIDDAVAGPDRFARRGRPTRH